MTVREGIENEIRKLESVIKSLKKELVDFNYSGREISEVGRNIELFEMQISTLKWILTAPINPVK